MADPLSVAGSVVGIAAVGVKVSISLFALAEAVSTASERIESIANDISSTCGILNQLGDLITPQTGPNGTHTSIFNATALADITNAVYHCRTVFEQVNTYLRRASRQVKGLTPGPNARITLSRTERAKWPFLRPQFAELRNDLRDSKSNLLLMVAVANLAVAQKAGGGRRIDEHERAEMKATIVRLQRAKTLGDDDNSDVFVDAKPNGFKYFFRRLGNLRAWRRDESDTSAGGESGDEDAGVVELRENKSSNPKPEIVEDVKGRAATIIRDRVYDPDQPQAEASNSAQRTNSPVGTPTLENPSTKITSESLISKSISRPRSRMGVESPAEIIAPTQLKNNISSTSSTGEGPVQASGQYEVSKDIPQSPDTPHVSDTNIDEPEASEWDVDRIAIIENIHEPPNVSLTVPISTADAAIQTVPEATLAGSIQNSTQEITAAGQPSTMDEDPWGFSTKPKKGKGKNKSRQQDTQSNEIVSEIIDVESKEVKELLHAWTTGVLPGLSSGIEQSIAVHPLSMPEPEIQNLLGKQVEEGSDPINALSKLNVYQRRLVTDHVAAHQSKLLYVNVWQNESIPTVFGELEVMILIWITSTPSDKVAIQDQKWFMGADYYRREKELKREREERDRTIINESMLKSEKEAYAKKAADEEVKKKAEEQAKRRAEEEAKKAAEQKLKGEVRFKKESEITDERNAPLKFKDAVGRKFSFPWDIVKTWKGMEDLIKKAFLHVDTISTYVQEGRYDLIGPSGEIILPQVWEHTVQPGWNVTMQLWPMPDPLTQAGPSKPPSSPSSALASGDIDPSDKTGTDKWGGKRFSKKKPKPLTLHSSYVPMGPPSAPPSPPSPVVGSPSTRRTAENLNAITNKLGTAAHDAFSNAQRPRPPPPQLPPPPALSPGVQVVSSDLSLVSDWDISSVARKRRKSVLRPFYKLADILVPKVYYDKMVDSEEEYEKKAEDKVVERLLLKWTGNDIRPIPARVGTPLRPP